MDFPTAPHSSSPRSISRGRCYVYVFPCAYEDILKLGFSRDPLERLQTLHRRYFEFFDLDRALLIETETVRDARRLEMTLAHGIESQNAPAPLAVRREAGGHTEWYRGAFEDLQEAARRPTISGHTMHQPALAWLRSQLIGRDHVYSWSDETLQAIESGAYSTETTAHLRRALRDALDAYAALRIELEPLVSPAVFLWRQRGQSWSAARCG